tara:strand:- start:186 stop:581 length:396 start_codon:yes stop_codon:yes gene_type:complete
MIESKLLHLLNDIGVASLIEMAVASLPFNRPREDKTDLTSPLNIGKKVCLELSRDMLADFQAKNPIVNLLEKERQSEFQDFASAICELGRIGISVIAIAMKLCLAELLDIIAQSATEIDNRSGLLLLEIRN